MLRPVCLLTLLLTALVPLQAETTVGLVAPNGPYSRLQLQLQSVAVALGVLARLDKPAEWLDHPCYESFDFSMTRPEMVAPQE